MIVHLPLLVVGFEIQDLKELVAKRLGLKLEELTIVDYDFWEAVVGKSTAYEFDLEIDRKVLPFKVMEDVKEWRPVDPSLFSTSSAFMNRALVPFDLSGPMELWIQDGQDMRLSLPVGFLSLPCCVPFLFLVYCDQATDGCCCSTTWTPDW